MIKRAGVVAFLLLAFAAAGCSVVPLGLEDSNTLLKTQDGTEAEYTVVKRAAEGSDGYFSLFGLIPFGSIDMQKSFTDTALQNGGDAMINVRYWLRGSFYFIGTYTSFEVKGDVIKLKKK